MKSYCIAQGAQLSALWWPRWVGWEKGGKSKKEGIYVCIQLIHFVVEGKLAQHCKTIILQKKHKTWNRKKMYILLLFFKKSKWQIKQGKGERGREWRKQRWSLREYPRQHPLRKELWFPFYRWRSLRRQQMDHPLRSTNLKFLTHCTKSCLSPHKV